MLWLKNKKNEDAPNFWFENDEKDEVDMGETEDLEMMTEKQKQKEYLKRIKQIEQFADCLILTSSKDKSCDEHEDLKNDDVSKINCEKCQNFIGIVDKYQSHNHTFTCKKNQKP